MIRTQLASSGYVHLLAHGEKVYLARVNPGLGLTVEAWNWWKSPATKVLVYGPDLNVKSAGFARMAVIDNAVRIAYARDAEIVAATVEGEGSWGSRVLPWRSRWNGKWPVAFSPNGELYLNRPTDDNLMWEVVKGPWGTAPTIYAGAGATEGIAFVGPAGEVVLTHINRGRLPGMLEPKVLTGGMTIGGPFPAAGGVATRLGSQWGWFQPEEMAFEPHGCQVPDGSWVLGFHQVNSQGFSGAVVYSDISLEEMLSAQVPDYADNKAIGVIWGNSEPYGYHAFPGNCETLFEADAAKRPVAKAAILGKHVDHPPEAYGYWADQVADIDAKKQPQFNYSDGERYSNAMDKAGTAHAVRLVQAYRNKGEGVDHFLNRISLELDRVNRPNMGIVAGFSPRNPPEQLTDDEVMEAIRCYDILLRRKDCCTLLAFDGARSGLLFHPEWNRWFGALAEASPGLPVIEHDATGDGQPPPVEKKMTRNMVLVGGLWHEVYEVPHRDAGATHGPVVGVRRVNDGLFLKVRETGAVVFQSADFAGADERLIPTPGAYVARRQTNAVVEKAGPWLQ